MDELHDERDEDEDDSQPLLHLLGQDDLEEPMDEMDGQKNPEDFG